MGDVVVTGGNSTLVQLLSAVSQPGLSCECDGSGELGCSGCQSISESATDLLIEWLDSEQSSAAWQALLHPPYLEYIVNTLDAGTDASRIQICRLVVHLFTAYRKAQNSSLPPHQHDVPNPSTTTHNALAKLHTSITTQLRSHALPTTTCTASLLTALAESIFLLPPPVIRHDHSTTSPQKSITQPVPSPQCPENILSLVLDAMESPQPGIRSSACHFTTIYTQVHRGLALEIATAATARAHALLKQTGYSSTLHARCVISAIRLLVDVTVVLARCPTTPGLDDHLLHALVSLHVPGDSAHPSPSVLNARHVFNFHTDSDACPSTTGVWSIALMSLDTFPAALQIKQQARTLLLEGTLRILRAPDTQLVAPHNPMSLPAGVCTEQAAAQLQKLRSQVAALLSFDSPDAATAAAQLIAAIPAYCTHHHSQMCTAHSTWYQQLTHLAASWLKRYVHASNEGSILDTEPLARCLCSILTVTRAHIRDCHSGSTCTHISSMSRPLLDVVQSALRLDQPTATLPDNAPSIHTSVARLVATLPSHFASRVSHSLCDAADCHLHHLRLCLDNQQDQAENSSITTSRYRHYVDTATAILISLATTLRSLKPHFERQPPLTASDASRLNQTASSALQHLTPLTLATRLHYYHALLPAISRFITALCTANPSSAITPVSANTRPSDARPDKRARTVSNAPLTSILVDLSTRCIALYRLWFQTSRTPHQNKLTCVSGDREEWRPDTMTRLAQDAACLGLTSLEVEGAACHVSVAWCAAVRAAVATQPGAASSFKARGLLSHVPHMRGSELECGPADCDARCADLSTVRNQDSCELAVWRERVEDVVSVWVECGTDAPGAALGSALSCAFTLLLGVSTSGLMDGESNARSLGGVWDVEVGSSAMSKFVPCMCACGCVQCMGTLKSVDEMCSIVCGLQTRVRDENVMLGACSPKCGPEQLGVDGLAAWMDDDAVRASRFSSLFNVG